MLKVLKESDFARSWNLTERFPIMWKRTLVRLNVCWANISHNDMFLGSKLSARDTSRGKGLAVCYSGRPQEAAAAGHATAGSRQDPAADGHALPGNL
jgi:hypothetical protein